MIRCRNMSDLSSYVYWRIYVKSLSPQQNFVTAISHAKSNQFEFVQFVVGTNSFAETKIFTKKAPIHMRQFVAATCHATYHLTCTQRVFYHCDVLQQHVTLCVLTFSGTPGCGKLQRAEILIKTVFLTNQKPNSDLGSLGLFLRYCLHCEMSTVFSGYEL